MLKREFNPFFIILLLTTAAVIFIYLNFLNHPYIYDDVSQIYSNNKLHDITNFKDIIFCNIRQTRILQNFSFAIDWWMGAGNTSAFRVTNLLLHLLNSFFLFKLINWISQDKSIAALATSFFLIHPMQIQSVHYIMGRISLLETMCILLVLMINIRVKERKTFLLMMLLMLSVTIKESCVLIPCYIILSDFFILKIPWRQLLYWKYLLYFSVYILFIPLIAVVEPGLKSQSLVAGVNLFPVFDYIIFQFHDLFFYFQLLFNPVNQSIIHGISQLDTETYMSAVWGIVISLAFLTVTMLNLKKRPAIAFLLIISYVSIFPYLNFVMQLINPFAEYRYYFFTGLILIMFTLTIRKILKKESMLIIVSLFFIIYWGTFTFLNLKPFAKRRLAFTNAHTLYPQDPRLNLALAAMYHTGNQPHLALSYFDQAHLSLEKYPYPLMINYYANVEYAIVLSQVGNFTKALDVLKAIDLNLVHQSFYCPFLNTQYYVLYKLQYQDQLSELISKHEKLKNERQCPFDFNKAPMPIELIDYN